MPSDCVAKSHWLFNDTCCNLTPSQVAVSVNSTALEAALLCFNYLPRSTVEMQPLINLCETVRLGAHVGDGDMLELA